MSEYLDRPLRTKEEALKDARKAQTNVLLALIDRTIKLTERMQETAK